MQNKRNDREQKRLERIEHQLGELNEKTFPSCISLMEKHLTEAKEQCKKLCVFPTTSTTSNMLSVILDSAFKTFSCFSFFLIGINVYIKVWPDCQIIRDQFHRAINGWFCTYCVHILFHTATIIVLSLCICLFLIYSSMFVCLFVCLFTVYLSI